MSKKGRHQPSRSSEFAGKDDNKDPISFVHIGLPKCMSTTMQRLWDSADNYNRYCGESFNDSVEQSIVFHKDKAEEVLESHSVNFTAPTDSARIRVLSSEGFASPFFPDRIDKLGLTNKIDTDTPVETLQRFWETKRRMIPKIFSSHARKVMIIVRDPVRWILSSHAQLVKEGHSIQLSDYLSQNESFIAESLNLTSLIRAWQDNGFEVTVLPLELYDLNTNQFWGMYETELQLPRPSNYKDKRKKNQTRYGRLDLHSQINELLQLLQDTLDESRWDKVEDIDSARKTIKVTRTWAVRRFIEIANEEQINQARELLKLDPAGPGQRSVELTPELSAHLSQNFISPLRGCPGWDTLDQIIAGYEESVHGPKENDSTEAA